MGGWLDQVGIKLTQLSTGLKVEAELGNKIKSDIYFQMDFLSCLNLFIYPAEWSDHLFTFIKWIKFIVLN